MAIRNRQSESSNRSTLSNGADLRSQAKQRLRHMLLEQLEQRQLLAVGPQLIGIQPNSSDLLAGGDVPLRHHANWFSASMILRSSIPQRLEASA